MTQDQLNQQIADATGEDLSEIQHRGFSLLEPMADDFDSEPVDKDAQYIDWDALERERNVALVEQPPYRRAA